MDGARVATMSVTCCILRSEYSNSNSNSRIRFLKLWSKYKSTLFYNLYMIYLIESHNKTKYRENKMEGNNAYIGDWPTLPFKTSKRKFRCITGMLHIRFVGIGIKVGPNLYIRCDILQTIP